MSMGTMIESDNIDKIFEASKAVMNTVFDMRVTRVEVIYSRLMRDVTKIIV